MKKVNRKDVCVVVHVYRKSLTKGEKLALKFIFKHLGKYDIFFMIPDNLSSKDFNYKGIKFASFPSSNFKNIDTYNKFALRKGFYERFKKYKYMLICQMDALVFSDQLLYWCNKGYDYIAAPWFGSVTAYLTKSKKSNAGCGNGGFCLRNIEKSIKVLDIVQKRSKRNIDKRWLQIAWFMIAVMTGKSRKIWLNTPADEYPFNEDGFWSLEAPKYMKDFKIAPFKEALKFSFERYPRKCYELNKNKLPFGCHAWEKYDRAFWVDLLIENLVL